MKTTDLNGTVRENTGSKDAKALRNQGNVPCVIYGGEELVHFYADLRAFSKLIYTPEVYLINVTVGDKTYQTAIREIQYHPVTDQPLHIDFIEVKEDAPVSLALPIRLTGASEGVRAGGKLQQTFRRLNVKGLAKDLPEAIEISLNGLKIGDSVRVRDLNIDGVEILDADSAVVVAVKTSRKARMAGDEEEEETEAAAEAEA